MHDSSFLALSEQPVLRQPIFLVAFEGWNDAGQAATHALTTLQRSWQATGFGSIDPEEFFDFSETRPRISIGSTGRRGIQWPSNELYYHRSPGADRDVVLLIGTEPQLRWRTFCTLITELAVELGASCLISLGAMLADVPHTLAPRVTGFASDHAGVPDLRMLDVRVSAYEGPTGIVGALHDAWQAVDVPAVSLWANVPHYISAAPNPQAAMALLERTARVLGGDIGLQSLKLQAQAFTRQINEALEDNPEAQEYVQQLESHFAGDQPTPAAPELIEELEKYLRSRRPDDEAQD